MERYGSIESVLRAEIVEHQQANDALQRALDVEREKVKRLEEQLRLANRHQVNTGNDLNNVTAQLAASQAQLRQVEGERDGLEQNCLNNHVTTEQADAKVMKLEGEKGMWASERIDLLTQLENAEADLTTLLQLVEALRPLIAEIKAEFDGCTHECERCGESDPLTTFDVYRTVEQLATLAAQDAGNHLPGLRCGQPAPPHGGAS